MKKFFLSVSLGVGCALAFPFFSHADVIMPGTHVVETCVRITNIDAFPDIRLVGHIDAVVSPTPNYFITQNQCLYKGYKFNSFTLLAVKKMSTLALDSIDSMKVKSASGEVFSVSLFPKEDIELNTLSVDESNPLQRLTTDYTILGFSGNVLIMYKSKEMSEFRDARPSQTIAWPAPSLTVGNITLPMTDAFRDIDHHQYRIAINSLAEKGFVKGYSDGTYRPDAFINRAEFLKIIFNGLARPTKPFSESCFSDVQEGWHRQYICSAKEMGVIHGYADGTFQPTRNISFVEAIKIFERAYGVHVVPTNPWYKAYVDEASGRNIIPKDIVSFSQLLTRGQVADIMARHLFLDQYLDMVYGAEEGERKTPVQYQDLTD